MSTHTRVTGSGLEIPGIHHVTAICSDPQRNIDFYVGLLGLRLVKKTVNFDDPGSYHLYYGDGQGSPGTIMTFFAWILPPMITAKARPGTGQVTASSFRIPASSFEFWLDRLAAAAAEFGTPETRFGEQVIPMRDPDGVPIELVAREGETPIATWEDGPVPTEHAIRGFAGVTLSLSGYERTAALLTGTMGFAAAGEEGARFRFRSGDGPRAGVVDLLCQPEGEPGQMGVGAVHHVAWRARSRRQEDAWRDRLIDAGFDVTPVLDRNYFESIYFREPGDVLFEIATDPPGFTSDEEADRLGSGLMLPPWLEPRRARIEARLPEIRLPVRIARR